MRPQGNRKERGGKDSLFQMQSHVINHVALSPLLRTNRLHVHIIIVAKLQSLAVGRIERLPIRALELLALGDEEIRCVLVGVVAPNE